MASDKEDGGPAFPVESIGFTPPLQGMSIRDWFAGQALWGMLASGDVADQPSMAALHAYELADAMLAARKS